MVNYIVGDATEPVVDSGIRIIVHINNDCGAWGGGFTAALSKKWSQPEEKYREWHSYVLNNMSFLPLGQIQLVEIPLYRGGAPLYVANMIAQHKFVSVDNPVAVRYNELAKCLHSLNEWAKNMVAMRKEMIKTEDKCVVTFHMPRIGCGIAGGDWNTVLPIISILSNGNEVYVYDLPVEE
jgi:O-acetyl-ADP-ribose deacetylase (regulator of RNase III)